MANGWGGKREGAGRPRKQPLREQVKLSKMLSDADAEQALTVLRDVMGNADVEDRVRVVAAREVLDRKFGKPTTHAVEDHQHEVTGPSTIRIK